MNITFKKWQRIKYQPCLPLGRDGKRATASAEHIALSRRAAGEGMVLLKNEGNLLPLRRGITVALFGKASADYVKGGGGSGDVNVPYIRNLCDGMEEKEAENKLHVYAPLSAFYRKEVEKQYEAGIQPGRTTEPDVPEDLLKCAAAECDVAVISICRYSLEGWDRKGEPDDGDFYLSPAEKKMVEDDTAHFENVAVVLTVGGMVDTAWCRENGRIGALLLAWQGGLEGGPAEADILVGDVCPSGKLTDTFASSFDDYPSSANFNESEDYVEYTDDIYVGYRYFETIPGAAAKVNYPFGFGLSYTTFDVLPVDAEEKDGVIKVTTNVTNTGKVAGKEVVQIYYSAPQGKLGKPAFVLAAFGKTDLLAPGESRDVILSFPVSQMASFDDVGAVAKSAYVLEAGDYTVYAGTSVENKWEAMTYTVVADTVTEQLTSHCAPHHLTSRLRADGTYESVKTSDDPVLDPHPDWPLKDRAWNTPTHILGDQSDLPRAGICLGDVATGKATVEELLAQLSDDELIYLVGGSANTGVSNTWSWGGLPRYGIPYTPTSDGPAGVRVSRDTGVVTTAWPCATLLACTWNEALVEEVGAAGGLELKENNMSVWLTPALNIHRSPLCGRNFEYYSEDPLVAGKMAAALARGIQSQRVGACAKHFCCNNKETNRLHSDSRVSERALREIYLKGFEICVKEAQPWAIMTSYNKMNGLFTSTNRELLTDILRGEWGFLGLVTTDWNNYALHEWELKAGNDIRMPFGEEKRLQKALEEGFLTREELIVSATRILDLILKLD